MSPVKDQGTEARMDEVARLLALMLKRDRPLQQTIVEMSEVGIKRGRIAELVGTSPAYAGVAIDRAKKRVGAAKKARATE